MRGSLVIFLMILETFLKRNQAQSIDCESRVDVLSAEDLSPQLSAIFSDRITMRNALDCALICYMKKCDVAYYDTPAQICQFTKDTAMNTQELNCPLLEAYRQPILIGENTDDVQRYCIQSSTATRNDELPISPEMISEEEEGHQPLIHFHLPPRNPPRILINPPIHQAEQEIHLVNGPSPNIQVQDHPQSINIPPKKTKPLKNTSIFKHISSSSFQTSSEAFGKLLNQPIATPDSQETLAPNTKSIEDITWDSKKSRLEPMNSMRESLVATFESPELLNFPLPSPIFNEVTIPWNGISKKTISIEDQPITEVFAQSTVNTDIIDQTTTTEKPMEKSLDITNRIEGGRSNPIFPVLISDFREPMQTIVFPAPTLKPFPIEETENRPIQGENRVGIHPKRRIKITKFSLKRPMVKSDQFGERSMEKRIRPPPLPPLSTSRRRLLTGNFRRRIKRPCSSRDRRPSCREKTWRVDSTHHSHRIGDSKRKNKGTGIARMKRSGSLDISSKLSHDIHHFFT